MSLSAASRLKSGYSIPPHMRHKLQLEQWVPYPLSDVFDFFANPDNLPPLMPRWQAARVDRVSISAPPPAPHSRPASQTQAAGPGSRLLITFRPAPMLPLRMRWDAQIAEFVWDDHFCDVQLSGPFGYWRHCHRVREQTRDGVPGTSVTDDVTYAFPLGILGDFAYLLGGAAQVRSLFHYRQQQLLKLLPAQLSARRAALKNSAAPA